MLPVFRGEELLPLDAAAFRRTLAALVEQIHEGRDYRLDVRGPSSLRISPRRFSPFGHRFDRADLTVQDTNDGIRVRYEVRFFKWFLAMLLLSFQVLVAFSLVVYFYADRLPAGSRDDALLLLIASLTFWAILWPWVMTGVYRVMVRRMFVTLLRSTVWVSGLSGSLSAGRKETDQCDPQ